MNFDRLTCFVFDFGMTLSSDYYFRAVPPGCPHWVDVIEESLFSGAPPLFDRWMDGSLTADDVARRVAGLLEIPSETVREYLEKGVRGLSVNEAVRDLAVAGRAMGKHTVLVTGNIDLFDSIVVPDLGLDAIFDAIVNSARSRTLDKRVMWPEAFAALPEIVDYADCFLVEDSAKNAARFETLGGKAHRYVDDGTLLSFLEDAGFPMALLGANRA